MADPTLLTSPLQERHEALGAKFAEFGGWRMPLEYAGGGVLKEHTAVRESVGVFDVSHLGTVFVRGAGAADFVNACLTNDLGRIGPGRAQYTLCCADDGGVVDDLIAYLFDDDELMLVPNAANSADVVRRLHESAPAGIEIDDRHRDFAVLAVQGRFSDQTLEATGLPAGHDYMSFARTQHAGTTVIACRTGYTGERGYELVVAADAAGAVWDEVLDAGSAHGIAACGLGARDTLRTEMGYPLHGQDLTREVTPVQARLGWAVGWKKPRFWGREALLAEREAGPKRVLRGLRAAGRGIPRRGMTVTADGRVVGRVTSGTFSPTLRSGIALALLDPSVAEGDRVAIDVRGRAEAFDVVRPPFVEPAVRSA